MALLEVDNLSIGYRTKQGYLKAVEGVSFSLDEGRSLGLWGNRVVEKPPSAWP
jgi:peptide/nickel transport system ATP-binding protein